MNFIKKRTVELRTL